MASRCARANTAVGTAASADDASDVAELASSVRSVGFGCLVVQPDAPFAALADLQRRGLAYALEVPSPPLLPRTQWCSNGSWYAWRSRQLHRARLLRRVLAEGVDLLAVTSRWRLSQNPLPTIRALVTCDGARLDALGIGPPFHKLFSLSMVWLRSTEATRALTRTVENRTWAAVDAIVFTEELNFAPPFAGIGCCHSRCLGAFASEGLSRPENDYSAENEPSTRANLACSDDAPPARGPPADRLSPSRLRWRPSWQADADNMASSTLELHARRWMIRTMRYGRCTRPHSSCSVPNQSAAAAPYPRNMMLGARSAFSAPCVALHPEEWSRKFKPHVLPLEAVRPIEVGLPAEVATLSTFGTKRDSGPKTQSVKSFNPSIVAAPAGLCARCAYVVSLRVDAMHQCRGGPLTLAERQKNRRLRSKSKFRGTALAVLDAELKTLAWTWLVNAPLHQVAFGESNFSASRRGAVASGAAGAFPPPWIRTVFDARLLNFDGERLLVVVKLVRQKAFTLAAVQLTGRQSSGGGVEDLRAWCSQKWTADQSWVRGRNQALFVAPALGATRPAQLLMQPWLGIVASLGAPEFRQLTLTCSRRDATTRQACGTHPPGQQLTIHKSAAVGFGNARLVSDERSKISSQLTPNQSVNAHRATGGGHAGIWNQNFTRADVKQQAPGFKASATANLVKATWHDAGGLPCHAFVGAGHYHRAQGKENRFQMKQGGVQEPFVGHGTVDYDEQHFQFGAMYTHFFYTVQPHPPYRMLATTAEFCIEAAQDRGDCESVQFVSGLALAADSSLLTAYGINDCEARLGRLSLSRLREMLRPLEGEVRVCSTEVAAVTV